MIPVMVEVAEEQFDSWIKTDSLKQLPLLERMAHITGEVTGRIFFGRRFNHERYNGETLTTVAIHLSYAIFNEAFDVFSIIFGSGFPKAGLLPRHRKLNKTISDLRKICKRLVNEIEHNGRGEPNLINRLLDLQKNGEESSLNEEQIIGEFIGIFGAGTDTTANFVASSVYFLCRYPEVRKGCRRS